MAVKAGVTPRLRPDHMAISPTSSTPSNLKYSGRKGITSVKPVNPIKLAAVTANRVLRHCVYEGALISETHSHSARLLDMGGVDETDPRRMTLHDQRAGPDTVAEEADAFHQRPVRHPGGGEDDVLAAREILRAVHSLEIGNAHRAAARLVLRRRHHQPAEDLAVQAAHGRGRQYPFGRSADSHDRVHSAADHRRSDPGREIAVANQPYARAGVADFFNQLSVPWPIEHHHDQVLDVPLERACNSTEVVADARVKIDGVLRGGADHEFLHVQVRSMQQTAVIRGGQHDDGIWRAGGAQIRSLEWIDGDIDSGQPRRHGFADGAEAHFLSDVEHRSLVPLPLSNHNRAGDRHAVHTLPHRLDGGLVALSPIAQPHRVRTRDGRLFDDAEEFKGEIRVQLETTPDTSATHTESPYPAAFRARSLPA